MESPTKENNMGEQVVETRKLIIEEIQKALGSFLVQSKSAHEQEPLHTSHKPRPTMGGITKADLHLFTVLALSQKIFIINRAK